MKYQVGDLLKYNDGVQDFICFIIEKTHNDVKVYWINPRDYDDFSETIYSSHIMPEYGWNKLS